MGTKWIHCTISAQYAMNAWRSHYEHTLFPQDGNMKRYTDYNTLTCPTSTRCWKIVSNCVVHILYTPTVPANANAGIQN